MAHKGSSQFYNGIQGIYSSMAAATHLVWILACRQPTVTVLIACWDISEMLFYILETEGFPFAKMLAPVCVPGAHVWGNFHTTSVLAFKASTKLCSKLPILASLPSLTTFSVPLWRRLLLEPYPGESLDPFALKKRLSRLPAARSEFWN